MSNSVALGNTRDLRGRQTLTPDGVLVTILINNYNYGRFLRPAIDSALNQTYPDIEVLVVDDGSTDDSREIINSYGARITSILKENGGQASAFNAGLAASKGEIICMLDADDVFHPDKVERVIPYCKPGSMLYHRLSVEPGSEITPLVIAPPIDYCAYGERYGFLPYMASPTSGLVFARDLALRLIPLPTEHVRLSADDFVIRGAALIGEVVGIRDVLATYRVHGGNGWCGKSRLKSPEFIAALETYLNQKLTEVGKKPILDFYNSIFAFEYVPQRSVDLARLAISVLSRHADFVTLNFSLRTLVCAMQCAIGVRSLYTRVVHRKRRRTFSLP
jgi:glycosyltransferase involved in cell wall biosynthesis